MLVFLLVMIVLCFMDFPKSKEHYGYPQGFGLNVYPKPHTFIENNVGNKQPWNYFEYKPIRPQIDHIPVHPSIGHLFSTFEKPQVNTKKNIHYTLKPWKPFGYC